VDANGTRYHLLLGREDWGTCLDQFGRPLWSGPRLPGKDNHLAWDDSRGQLTLESLLFLYVASPQDVLPEIEDRRGAACDRYGNWYWINAANRKVRVLSSGSKQPSDFWPLEQPACPSPPDPAGFQPVDEPEKPAVLDFSGLAVTEDHYLVVGVLEPPSLLVFDLHAARSPEQLFWPEGVDFIPFDMAPRPGGGAWILDRENRRYWALDHNFNVITSNQESLETSPEQKEIFQNEGAGLDDERGRPATFFPLGIRLADSSPVDARDPVAIEALPDHTVLILDRLEGEGFSEISRYSFDRRLGDPVSTDVVCDLVEEERQAGFTLVAHDFACTNAKAAADGTINCKVYIASANGNQAFAFTLTGTKDSLTLVAVPKEYLPMRLFSGKGLVACSGTVFYDMDERWLPLVLQLRPRYHTRATLSHTFDGHQPDCTWHRLMLEACIPPDCAILVESRAANQEADLSARAWQAEKLYLRGDGAELPYTPNVFRPGRSAASLSLAPDEAGPAAPTGSGTWEALFQNASGRYLQLRLTMEGQGRRTPRLRALRAYYPRFSYLEHYLPAVYRQEPESASFLDRFLANLEGFFTATEDKIAAVRLLFDVDSAPPEALDWLADWLGVALDPAWDDYRRRLFIHHAMHFFQYRGTSYGLRMALHLALDECPSDDIFADPGACCSRPGSLRIVESFSNRRMPTGVLTGQAASVSTCLSTSPAPTYWQPADGSAVLNQRYQEVDAGNPYPLQDPGDTLIQAWQAFSLAMLGFVPDANPAVDCFLWREYLAQRYGTLDAYCQAYQLSGQDAPASFDQVQLPAILPADGRLLEDWYRFETVFLPVARQAHQFSVLLPIPADAGPGSDDFLNRVSLACRVINLEKPAHTIYSIKFFWAMFRVGEARLGLDTLLDLGSRSPYWMPPMVLGQGYLAERTLATNYPYDITGDFTDRLVLQCECTSSASSAKPASQQKIIKGRTVLKRSDGCWARRRGSSQS
jgi:phage tail-like protein